MKARYFIGILIILFTIINVSGKAFIIKYVNISFSYFHDNDKDSIRKQMIIEADSSFLKEDYEKALSDYKEALKGSPNDFKLQGKIKRIERFLSSTKSTTDLYILTITMADDFFSCKEYIKAKKVYQKASTLIRDNKYAIERVTELEHLLSNKN